MKNVRYSEEFKLQNDILQQTIVNERNVLHFSKLARFVKEGVLALIASSICHVLFENNALFHEAIDMFKHHGGRVVSGLNQTTRLLDLCIVEKQK